MATKLYDGKVQGQTSAAAALATQAIELWDDGWMRWTDANGDRHSLPISGDLAALIRVIFVGAGAPTQSFFG